MNKNFDFEGAKKSGYSDDEINAFIKSEADSAPKYENYDSKKDKWYEGITKNASNFYQNIMNPTGKSQKQEETQQPQVDHNLLKNMPDFDAEGAAKAGYSTGDINEYLKENQPKKSLAAKGGRIVGQYALGRAQGTASGIVYDLAVAPLASKEAQNVPYREGMQDDIDNLELQKSWGDWSNKDQELLDHLKGQMADPQKSMENVQTADLSIRGLAEKLTGVDLTPEGILEKAANWAGMMKQNPERLTEIGLNPKALFKAFSPSGTDISRGLAAGTALQMAEQNKFGPIGTLAVAIAGDIVGHAPKGALAIAKNPKKFLANVTNTLTMNNTKRAIAKEFIEDARKSGLQLDVGTLTQSPLVQFIQARGAQSGLTGSKLSDFRKQLSGQIIKEYEGILDNVGNLRFENSHQAAEALKDALKTEEVSLGILGREQPTGRPLQGRISIEPPPQHEQALLNRIAPQEFQNTYQAGETLRTAAEDIKTPLTQEFNQRWQQLNEQIDLVPGGPQGQLAREMTEFVNENSGSLLLGESAAEHRVVRAAQNLANRLAVEGGEMGISLRELIQTKRTLADIANWEFGGSNFKSAYKKLVGDVDRAITRTLEHASPELAEQYRHLNAEYSNFKDVFENKNVLQLFEPKNNNYNAIYDSYSKNPDKLRSLEDIFHTTQRGEQVLNQVKRDHAQRIISNPNVTERELRNLAYELGPDYYNDVAEFIRARQGALERPGPRAAQQRRLGLNIEVGAPQAPGLAGRKIKESEHAIKKKLYETLSNKTPEQMLKMMDSVDGIRKLKRSLNLTAEGKQVFNDLCRYKLDDMITKNMTNNVTENVKLGTFSNLLKSADSKALAKEILGKEAYDRLRLLQKNSGRLAESAEKFFNASKSGTTASDVAFISGAVVGVLTGNPFIAIPAIAKIGGMRFISNLIADPEYLRYLEEAILTNNKIKFNGLLEKMRPAIIKATQDAKRSQQQEKNGS